MDQALTVGVKISNISDLTLCHPKIPSYLNTMSNITTCHKSLWSYGKSEIHLPITFLTVSSVQLSKTRLHWAQQKISKSTASRLPGFMMNSITFITLQKKFRKSWRTTTTGSTGLPSSTPSLMTGFLTPLKMTSTPLEGRLPRIPTIGWGIAGPIEFYLVKNVVMIQIMSAIYSASRHLDQPVWSQQ